MSIRIYLNEDIAPQHLIDHARRCKSRGRQDEAIVQCQGMKIPVDGDGRLYYQLTEDIAHPAIAIPRPLQNHIDMISWWTRIPSVPHRTLGVYKTDGADAQLDVEPQDPNWRRLVICGQDIAELSRLYSEIRSGRTLPYESWENELTEPRQLAMHSQLLPPPGE